MRNVIKAGMATAVFGLALLAPVTAAQADIGDGYQSCNSGEICFKQDNGGGDIRLRHFFNDDLDHGNDYFSDSNVTLLRNMSSELNRDTECVVTLWATNSSGAWYNYYTMSKRTQSTNYVYVGDGANDRNVAHRRCW